MKRLHLFTLALLLTTAVLAQQPPLALMKKNTTFVPLRYLGEWLGATVQYTAQTQGIHIEYNKHTITLTIGARAATIDGVAKQLSVASFEKDGITYVPLRFIGEAFSAGVAWDGKTECVTVTHPATKKTLTLVVRRVDELALKLRKQLRDNVHILEGGVKVVSITANSLVLAGDVPTLKPDDIVIDATASKILRRVLSVEDAGQGRVLVKTLPASFEDCFKTAEFVVNLPYTPPAGKNWKETKSWSGPGNVTNGKITVLGSYWQIRLETDEIGPATPEDVNVTVYDKRGVLVDKIERAAYIVIHQYRGPGAFTIKVNAKVRKWKVVVEEVM
jgi:hypothetical protein